MFASNVSLRRSVCPAVRELVQTDLEQVNRFLSSDPIRAVILHSLIQDNGIVSPANRGTFYGYFVDDQLLAVGLLGHSTMFATAPESEATAVTNFANTALSQNINCGFVLGTKSQTATFCQVMTAEKYAVKLARSLQWMVCQESPLPLTGLQVQRAGLQDAEIIAEAQAQMFIEATGMDPRAKDPEGFIRRVNERISRQRSWIKLDQGQVVYKTEIQSETEAVAYLEGVWTREDHRERGIAKACLNEIVHRLLKQKQFVTLLVEEDDVEATAMYEKLGFTQAEEFRACYFEPKA